MWARAAITVGAIAAICKIVPLSAASIQTSSMNLHHVLRPSDNVGEYVLIYRRNQVSSQTIYFIIWAAPKVERTVWILAKQQYDQGNVCPNLAR